MDTTQKKYAGDRRHATITSLELYIGEIRTSDSRIQVELIVLAVMPAAVAKSKDGIQLLPPELSSIANLVSSFSLTD